MPSTDDNFQPSTNRIAKNSVYLAIRTVVLALIQIYLSRVVLNNLGVIDFGIYNLVGSIILFWASVRGLFASATQRYMNVARASGSADEVTQVVSVSLWLHIALALAFLLVVGVLGFVAIDHFLVIPEDRLWVARWIFLFSLIASAYTILSSPYLASTISHERMDAYAMATIFESSGMLMVALLIPHVSVDHLLFYGLGVSCMSIVANSYLIFFARRHFDEMKHAHPEFFKEKAKELGAFAGWNFLGNASFHFVSEGVNLLLNLFFGPALNAARGIANQVNSLILNFSSTIMTASNPQLCVLAVKERDKEFNRLIILSTKGVYFIALAIVSALYVSLDEVLELWLVDVPEYAKSFTTVILAYGLIRCVHVPINSIFLAYARMKRYQLTEICILPATLLLAYIALRLFSAPPVSVFIVLTIVDLANLIAVTILASKITPFDLSGFLRNAIGRIAAVTIMSLGVTYLILHYTTLFFVFKCILGAGVSLVFSFFLGFDRVSRKSIREVIRSRSIKPHN